MQTPDPSGKTVLITAGEFAMEEGVCLGRSPGAEGLWAVSPHGSNRILALRFTEEFGVLLNSAQESGNN